MLICGVDIAARKGGHNCGLALIDGARLRALDEPADDLLWLGAIDGTSLAAVAAVVKDLRARAAGQGLLLALERQYTKLDPSMTEKLIGSRLRFEIVAEINGVPFELNHASTWQTILKVLGPDTPMKLTKPKKAEPGKKQLAPRPIRDTKAAARLLCSRLYPGIALTGDQCDALLQARYSAWQRRAA